VRLHELLGGVDVLGWVGDRDVDVSAITHDSRRAARGSCFACIPGEVTDGHLYAQDAVDAGATALLVERELDVPVSQARVANVRAALGPAADRLYGHPSRDLHCLAVTGTNGKTTVTYLLEAIAKAAGQRVGVIGTVGARIEGTPLPGERTTPEADDLQELFARMRDAGARTVAVEASSHALAQHRVDGTWFRAGCFTNLSQEHLDYHRSMAAYFEAKARLFEPERVATAAVNVEDAYGVELTRRVEAAGIPLLTFASSDTPRSAEADIVAENVMLTDSGANLDLVDQRSGVRSPIASPLLGRFNVNNTLAATAMALVSGLPVSAVVAGLEQPLVVPGRLERVLAEPFTVLVDYAHTPDALTGALDAAHSLAHGGRVLVAFGAGGGRDREKRPAMGRAAGAGADVVVLTSDNPRGEQPEAIADAVLEGLRNGSTAVTVELDRRAAIRHALSEARPGDVVVIAGKGHETGQTLGERTIPFDDRVVAREELEALGCA
jgi:UDP-N-acetylmuramoyl-L-alanyl-D-glutamate--2,6-diaminopimelate ligase